MKAKYWRYILLVVLCLFVMGFFSIFDRSFIGPDSIMHLFTQAAILGITAFGLTIVMKAGHYDFCLELSLVWPPS